MSECKAPTYWNAKELSEMDIPPLDFLVDGLIPTASSGLIAAPPKSYKSYFMLDMCIQIAKGETFLDRKCKKAKCWYLDLESSNRRPQNRLRQILSGRPVPDNLLFSTNDGGASEKVSIFSSDGKDFADRPCLQNQIRAMRLSHPDLQLIVIDMFKCVKPKRDGRTAMYDSDSDDMGIVQSLVNELGISIYLVHHTRKMQSPDDVFGEISGSTGLTGGLDVLMLISKKRRDDLDATLAITGKDIAPQELSIKWRKETMRWNFEGSADDIRAAEERGAYEKDSIVMTIKRLLKENNGKWEGTASDLINASRQYGGYYAFNRDEKALGRKLQDGEELESKLYKYDFITIIHDPYARVNRKKVRLLTITDGNHPPKSF